MTTPQVRFPPHLPITFDGGAPDVADLVGLQADEITFDGQLYMTRYYLTRSLLTTVRLHHLHTSDPGRDLHDHPWDFASLLLTGAYRETTEQGTVDYRAPCLVIRMAETPHSLDLLEGPMWTLVTTGSVRRQWGFALDNGGWCSARVHPDGGRYGNR